MADPKQEDIDELMRALGADPGKPGNADGEFFMAASDSLHWFSRAASQVQ